MRTNHAPGKGKIGMSVASNSVSVLQSGQTATPTRSTPRRAGRTVNLAPYPSKETLPGLKMRIANSGLVQSLHVTFTNLGVFMAMGAPVRGHAVEEPQVSSNAGRPPTRQTWGLGVLAVMLIAAGCALLIVSYEPRPAAAAWVGSR